MAAISSTLAPYDYKAKVADLMGTLGNLPVSQCKREWKKVAVLFLAVAQNILDKRYDTQDAAYLEEARQMMLARKIKELHELQEALLAGSGNAEAVTQTAITTERLLEGITTTKWATYVLLSGTKEVMHRVMGETARPFMDSVNKVQDQIFLRTRKGWNESQKKTLEKMKKPLYYFDLSARVNAALAARENAR